MKTKSLDILLCPLTKSPLRLEIMQGNNEEVEFGLLHAETITYPIVAGIPILFPHHEHVIQAIREQRWNDAIAQAMFTFLGPQNLWRIAGLLQQTWRFRSLGNKLLAIKDRLLNQSVARDFGLDGNKKLNLRQMFETAYFQYKIRSPENFNYNYYRLGMPNYLAALSYIYSVVKNDGRVLDLAGGAGHLTCHMGRLSAPFPTVCLDGFFFSLYIAKKYISPKDEYVCADIRCLPFIDGAFTYLFSSDAFFNFQSKWSSLRELERITDDKGQILLIWLKNKLKDHLYSGRPLSPAGYKNLVQHLNHRIIADKKTLERYLQGNGPAAKDQIPLEQLDGEDVMTIWIKKQKLPFEDFGPFAKWPHAEGVLGINPLYKKVSTNANEVEFQRQFPSSLYEREHAAIKTYLPETIKLTQQQLQNLNANHAEGLEELIRKVVVLGFPEAYLS